MLVLPGGKTHGPNGYHQFERAARYPAEIRKKLKLKGGTKVSIEEANGVIQIKPNPYDALLALEGCMSHIKEDVEGWWMEEKRKEREREEADYEAMLRKLLSVKGTGFKSPRQFCGHFSARLKPCPYYKARSPRVFPQPVKPR